MRKTNSSGRKTNNFFNFLPIFAKEGAGEVPSTFTIFSATLHRDYITLFRRTCFTTPKRPDGVLDNFQNRFGGDAGLPGRG